MLSQNKALRVEALPIWWQAAWDREFVEGYREMAA